MSQYKYSWTKHFGADPQAIGEWVYSLPDRSAASIVEAASDKRSPAHALFEWDDTAAAQRYRMAQACTIVQSLRVEIVTKEHKAERVMAYIRSSERGGYVPTMEATEDELTEAEQRCWREMQTFRNRNKGIRIAREVIQIINHIERTQIRKGKAAAKKRA